MLRSLVGSEMCIRDSGNAVGVRNHKWFVMFVCSTALLALCTLAGCIYYVADQGLDSITGVVAIVLVIYSIVISCCVGSLAVYHLRLVCRNVTTNEDIKRAWDREPNVYDQGCADNCCQILCSHVRPSYLTADPGAYLDDLAVVDEEEQEQNKVSSEHVQTAVKHSTPDSPQSPDSVSNPDRILIRPDAERATPHKVVRYEHTS
eukprot:TRINITY_DN20294_c0_g1_i5.p1 TRINITY_DN20294_c0_g1~~TRINITY_DN20294_c0_g1_i5.p1  ORF type:complete len:204 (+),score=36.45 TRINITY_DN20294_c0_g1_i5:117-728(+)